MRDEALGEPFMVFMHTLQTMNKGQMTCQQTAVKGVGGGGGGGFVRIEPL